MVPFSFSNSKFEIPLRLHPISLSASIPSASPPALPLLIHVRWSEAFALDRKLVLRRPCRSRRQQHDRHDLSHFMSPCRLLPLRQGLRLGLRQGVQSLFSFLASILVAILVLLPSAASLCPKTKAGSACRAGNWITLARCPVTSLSVAGSAAAPPGDPSPAGRRQRRPQAFPHQFIGYAYPVDTGAVRAR
jgi:hypothetical protein